MRDMDKRIYDTAFLLGIIFSFMSLIPMLGGVLVYNFFITLIGVITFLIASFTCFLSVSMMEEI